MKTLLVAVVKWSILYIIVPITAFAAIITAIARYLHDLK